MTTEVITKVRIYFSDTDAIGIVYHANYLDFAERARTELLRSIGVDVTTFSTNHIYFLLRAANLEYIAPARLDDVLLVRVFVSKMGNTSVDFMHEITNEATGQLLCKVTCTIVCVKGEDGIVKAIRVPDELRALV